MLAYLADPQHRTIMLTPDAMPLGIGFLAAHASKILGPEIRFKLLFAHPEHLIEKLKHTKPDFLGVTNYCWSYALHSRMLRYARGLYPDLLTVMDGPNIPLDHEDEEHRLRQTPGLDVYVLNEGEQAFAALLTRYHECGLQKARLLREALPSAMFVDPVSREVRSD